MTPSQLVAGPDHYCRHESAPVTSSAMHELISRTPKKIIQSQQSVHPAYSIYNNSEYSNQAARVLHNQQQPQNSYHSESPHIQHMYRPQQYSMGVTSATTSAGFDRSRDHQRTPSTSTIASSGPRSPFPQNLAFPHIANSDTLPSQYADYTHGKNMAIRDAAVDQLHHYHNQPSEDLTTDDFAPSRQSMSSYGNDSPATPQSGSGDNDVKVQSMSSNDFRNAIQLHRTESQVYQDELYNPNFVYTSAPSTKSTSTYLSPQRNLITERLQTANAARSTSPNPTVNRERSPYRQSTSPNTLLQEWKPSPGQVGTAANMRLQQKEEAERAELARQHPPLRREPTKTMSPQDAVLEYSHDNEPPLFQDSIPDGYKQHVGGSEQWSGNSFFGQSASAFSGLPTSSQSSVGFPNLTTTDQPFVPDFDFSLLPQPSDQTQSAMFPVSYQTGKLNLNDATPNFPPALPSMESSVSDLGPSSSSQESIVPRNDTPQRPDDTRANTGTYTCTYHGCIQRFETHQGLQKHKRDFHRSQQQQSLKDAASVTSMSSASPESAASPEPSETGMTSAAILARNSQAGPHKCTRINPSTGKPCNTIFSRPYDLTRHEDTIHNNRKQKVRCPLCREEKTFSRNDALTRHMRVVHPEVEAYGKRGRRGD